MLTIILAFRELKFFKNSNLDNHWSQIPVTNVITKKYEILWELPKCYTETKSEQMTLEKNGADRIDQINVAANLPFVKNAISAKYNKAKRHKTRYACIETVYISEHCQTKKLYNLG